MAHTPAVAGFPAHHASWRPIAGVTFQQIKPYVLAGVPDRARPDLVVWLRRIDRDSPRALWSATIVRGITRISEHRAQSATGAVRRVMADQTWQTAPEPEIRGTRQTALYPDNLHMTPAGWYADRPTAHDRRWDR